MIKYEISTQHNYQDLSIIQKYILILMFAVFIIVGLFIASDYGLPWDDYLQQYIGQNNYELAVNGSQKIFDTADQFYGSAIELPFYAIGKIFNLYSTGIYVRHLLTNLYFIFSLFILFKLVLKLFRNYNLAIIAVLFLYLSPRIFAHSFFNTKDIPFMSAFIISIYTMYNMLDNPNRKNIFLHAFASAFLIDVRIIGVLIPVLTIGMSLIYKLLKVRKTKVLSALLWYFGVMVLFIFAMWPALWYHPSIFLRSFVQMSKFPWNGLVLFNGNMESALDLPWNYIPVWIGISTPLIISLLYITGVFELIISAIKSYKQYLDYNKLFVFVLTLIPIGLFILFNILHSTFYDGWRHLFFLYPLILIGAIQALYFIVNNVKFEKYIYIIVIALMIFPLWKIINLHPYQQTYFNAFVDNGKDKIHNNWEMDYWGLSYKEGFEKILELDNSDTIRVIVANISANSNWKLVNDKEARIILVTDISKANYFISNYRFHPQKYDYNMVDSICVERSLILGIFKLKSK